MDPVDLDSRSDVVFYGLARTLEVARRDEDLFVDSIPGLGAGDSLLNSRSEGALARELGGIVFSLEQGVVTASWPGRTKRVPLGDLSSVIEMMRDFIAQTELGESLLRRLA